jgi:hypothetical protein
VCESQCVFGSSVAKSDFLNEIVDIE